MSNVNLNKAKTNKNDEFYTRYEDIQLELNHYIKHFEGKTVLCNCDNPFESNFCKFFLINFNYLKLKRLICTSYNNASFSDQPSFFDYAENKEEKSGLILDIAKIPTEYESDLAAGRVDALLRSGTHGVRSLKGSGDFRSNECISYLKEADVAVTNVPFSLFREYISLVSKYNKKFLIIGPKHAVIYNELFSLIQANKVWCGRNDVRSFMQPDGTVRTFGNVGWFTNIETKKRHESLPLTEHYRGNEDEYPKFENFDAIFVDKVSRIPCDYKPCWLGCPRAAECAYARKKGFDPSAAGCENKCSGIMAVPVTYFEKHDPEQFEIVETDRKGTSKAIGIQPIGKKWCDTYFSQGNTGHYTSTMRNPVLLIDGVAKSVYRRVYIRKKEQ
ncbi:MAG: hypothetical protein IJI14_13865 [Anaerolineaceae bacterium]|nr:hypothetical protein [Anaerolineaceae bacterium]